MLLRRRFALWLAAGTLLLVTTTGCESMQRLNRWEGPTDHTLLSVQDPFEEEIAESDDHDEIGVSCGCGR